MLVKEPGRTVRGNIRKRALEACTFCRRRKIRCDGGRPVCENCKKQKRQCLYDRKSEDDSLIENPQSSSQSRSPSVNGTENEGHSATVHSAAGASQTAGNGNDNQSISRILVADDGQSTYHGQTSALYELREGRGPANEKRLPKNWVKKALLAEAAVQRQMETINFRSGNLDFDGADPELGMHLLSLHWNRQHHSFLITYRPSFMRDMSCGGSYFSKLLLNAIYFGSAKFSPRLEVRKDANDVRTAGWRYRQRVKELLGECLDKSDITTIQALLVMANSLFALGNERSAAWLYSGLAFRMIIDLGMHSEASTLRGVHGLSDEDIEIRRRVFWGAFVVDKIQSLYHGRMPTLPTEDARVPIEFLDLYEEHEQWQPFAYKESSSSEIYGQAYSVSTFIALCKLSVLMHAVLMKLYAERIMQSSANELSGILKELQADMDTWRRELPKHLSPESFTSNHSSLAPHVLSLSAMYNVLLVLLHRPFVSDGHLFHNARSLSVNSLRTCISAASKITNILRIYHQAFSIQRAPYLISYATYVAATIHVRIAAQRAPQSDAHQQLLVCLEVLGLNEGTNWAAKRAKAIVKGLMQKLNVNVDGMIVDLNRVDQDQRSTNMIQFPPDELAGFSPSFNIEAVIQSFAKDQQHGSIQNSEHIDGTRIWNIQQPNHSDTAPAIGTQNVVVSNPDYYQYPQAGQDETQPWLEEWQFSAYPIDDVLFGFNGSVTDGFFQQPF